MSVIKAVGFGACAAPSSAVRRGSQTGAKRRFGRAGRFAAVLLGAVVLALVGASAAGARTGYVSNDRESSITPIDLAANTAGTPIAAAHWNSSIAITPNGKLAYAPTASGVSMLFPFDLETSLAESPISLAIETKTKVEPEGLAITPNGKYVYVADEETNGHEGSVSVVEVATGKVVKVIAAGFEPEGVAITPNGQFAWVANKANVKQGTVTVIEHASEPENAKVVQTIDIGTAVECKDEGGKPANACVEPEKIAISPNGQAAYVADGANGTVTKVNTKTYAVEATITVGEAGEDLREPNDIAITPNGQTAYASNGEAGTVVPINLKTNEAGAPITVGSPESEPRGLAITPSGKTLYVADEAEGKVKAIDTSSNTVVAEIAVAGEPDGVAIVPDQGPTAAFSATSEAAGSASTFNAGGSSAAEGGTIASYEWSFGDGTSETTTTPEASHVYAHGGEYEVKVRTTDGEGCSQALVFTGQTAYCNADAAAEVHHTITVPSATAEAVVSEVTPNEGPEAGLTMVTIHGEHLEDATEVSFGGSSAGIPIRDTATEIEVETPAHAAGAVEVCTMTASGTGCKADAFTYTAPAPPPVISEVTPDEGPEEGHTKVTIHGEHLEGATRTSFGIASTGTLIRDTATEVEVETPSEGPGTARVCVTTVSGRGCKQEAFTYTTTPPPVVSEVTPDEGPEVGHTMVTIHGEHLLDATGTTISFGGSPAGSPARETETEIEVETPMHAAGAVEVCATTFSGTDCKADAFTYKAPVVVSKNKANVKVNSEPVSEVQSLETTCSTLSLGVWTPGSESNSEAHCELTATSTAASSTLTAEDTEAASKGAHAGYLENAGSYLADPLQAQATDGHSHGTSAGFLSLGVHPVALLSFSEPISPDPVAFTVKQHIGAEEGLRKGAYQETVTLTLANTEP